MQPLAMRVGASTSGNCAWVSGDLLRLGLVYGTTNNNGNVWVTTASTGWTPPSFTPRTSAWYDNKNQMVNAGLGIHHDPAGNQDAIGGYSFSFDAENRLKSSAISGSTTTYAYDGEGRRVKKGSTVFVYDASGKLAAEYGGTPSTAGPQYLTADHLGSTRLITNALATQQQCRDYLPFGEELPQGAGGRPGCYNPGAGGGEVVTQIFQDSFATPPVPAQYATVAAGSQLGPWSVGGGGIDRIGGYWQSADADGASVDLNGDAPGTVSASLSSLPGWTAGATYRVTFSLSGNPDRTTYAPQAGPATVRVTTASSSQDYSFNVANPDGSGVAATKANQT